MENFKLLLSLFCGAGGLDLGFQNAGFEIGLAFDIRPDSVDSYNRNLKKKVAVVKDIQELDIDYLDALFGEPFTPHGVIGGPPCQSFSRANVSVSEDDPRHKLPNVYATLLLSLSRRKPIDFFVFENVTGLAHGRYKQKFYELKELLGKDFNLTETTLNAINYRTPQYRERLFLVGINANKYPSMYWQPPLAQVSCVYDRSIRSAIGGLPEPIYYQRGLKAEAIPYHPNHWCMQPKSQKFSEPNLLKPGDGRKRSFKTLSWDRPSITVAYGHREVHVHPNCKRRLSVYEAMLIQGFPRKYVLQGSMSSQITQVSEAVPPPLAEAVATSLFFLFEENLASNIKTINT